MTRTLLSMGYSHRKLSRISHKANTFARVMFREQAREWVSSLDQLVFIDETSKNRATINRQYGWGPKRTTLFNKDFVLKGKRMSVVGAYGTRGLLAVDVIPETYNQARFESFFKHFVLPELNPYPGPNSIVVIDNARIHNRRKLFDMCFSKGALLLFLSPYSPDMNPIEKFWATTKMHLKKIGGYNADNDDRNQVLFDALSYADAIRNHVSNVESCGWVLAADGKLDRYLVLHTTRRMIKYIYSKSIYIYIFPIQ
jgi:hypothetical protein